MRTGGASPRAGGGGEAEHGERQAGAVLDGIVHLRADQALVAEVMVACAMYSFHSLLAAAPAPVTVTKRSGRRASRLSGGTKRVGSVAWVKAIGLASGVLRLTGGGRTIRPSRCMRSMVTLAIMLLSPPSGLVQPVRRQNSVAIRERLRAGGPAIRARSSAISSCVKSRP